ncbi:hypothetical protein EHQ68_13005 [Leptospira congkakensis]|uniref:Uncharacterized protein n=1 Tax=Leptospira congkakensis TaxID=2484932 RepID=A0A4Z1A5H1_9LEPT|nr:hypothetical protein EHQ68_13005 [Leptospira congkakensis]TGL94211.1 hypothetical protein EHQ69_07025 [Leptospira congkakensis]TGL94380.1 hypothetical protein EHQ70_13765 [Leptospira congkakensis]
MFPIQSVWLIRISLIYLLLGTSLGTLLMLNKIFVLSPEIWKFLPLHYSIVIWGFLIQFIMGNAYWMFPKHMSERPRGSVKESWFLFYSYNLGLLLLIISKFILTIPYLTMLGKLFIFFGLVTFIKLIWVRSISYR